MTAFPMFKVWPATRKNCNTSVTISTWFIQICFLTKYTVFYYKKVTDKQGGLLVYIKSHLPSKLLSTHNISKDIQVIPFELNLRKENVMYL